jgi:hypothetical protein
VTGTLRNTVLEGYESLTQQSDVIGDLNKDGTETVYAWRFRRFSLEMTVEYNVKEGWVPVGSGYRNA